MVATATATATGRELAPAAAEGALRNHGTVKDIDVATRRAQEAANRRYNAASWLRRTVGIVCARDLPEEPSEEEFRLGLRNGIVLCNALNKVQPCAIPKVVEARTDTVIPADGSALCAYQYFENLRNFLVSLQDIGLPTFELSDLEKGGKGVRVVDCVLALKSFSESKTTGRQTPCKYGSITKPSMFGKSFILKNSDAFMNKLMRSHTTEPIQKVLIAEQSIETDCCLESTDMTTSESLNMLVRTLLLDKKPEEVPSIVESLLIKVIQEYECRAANQHMVNCIGDLKGTDLFSRPEKSLPEKTSTSKRVKMGEEEPNLLKMMEDVSSVVRNGDCADEQFQPGVEISIALQQKHIQELRNSLSSVKSGMEQLRIQHSEDFTKIGRQLYILSNAASGYHKVLEDNRKLYNQIQDLKGNIRVYCRVRPFLPGQANSSSSVAGMEERTITITTPTKYGKDGSKSFTFNKVFGPAATQEEVFSDMQPLIRSVLDGFNVCIFAYGQTGSGKTYTMSGPNVLSEESVGVNYRALNDLFNLQAQRKGTIDYEISVQMIEIYNEQVRDLLQDSGNRRLEIRNTSQRGFAVPDASIVPVASTSDVAELMNQGQKNRVVGSTAINDRSSRSHSCLTVHVQGRDITSGTILRGCMHLVDLAGSERVDKSEVVGDRLKEALYINKSLSALGDVIASLAQKNSHVPYRNSKLTQLLQDSLGGQAKTLMFVHISPEPDAVNETISTLKFAERVASVELGAAKANKEGGEVRELKEQIACLKAALAKKEGEPENIQSTQSSPNIYGISKGNATPVFRKNRQPMEEVGNLEVRNNVTPMQKVLKFDIPGSGILVEHNSPNLVKNSWVGNTAGGDDQFENSNSVSEQEPNLTTHNLLPNLFYQRYTPGPQRGRVESVPNQEPDEFNGVTNSCFLDQDMVTSASGRKVVGITNGSVSNKKKPRAKNENNMTTRSTNPTCKSPPQSQKRLQTPVRNSVQKTPTKNGKQLLSGTDGRRTPNGKTSTAK
ncbi:kinesin-like protein KIN-14Q isoform X1 [Hordeum vulgare subsp. vulgare]|uniref:kinesin-like protein KIN-14Q isoform X1 n=1 Tax=Hordeum vulgare subsp. vulgare TaxID=112509 RepID=UPI000295426A|nr:kinesin-like protein KIN-14Q isoform X1 [Hordeum vulgare subsp. vulgare]